MVRNWNVIISIHNGFISIQKKRFSIDSTSAVLNGKAIEKDKKKTKISHSDFIFDQK